MTKERFYPSEWCFKNPDRERIMASPTSLHRVRVVEVKSFTRRIGLYLRNQHYQGPTSFTKNRIQGLLSYLCIGSLQELKGRTLIAHTIREEIFGNTCNVICGVAQVGFQY
ncbi:MAG: hypothetical protein KKD94_01845 [Nanoarchaeota archaeon]|nr:hypothetical protein [Nanoarchaeota archaeon]